MPQGPLPLLSALGLAAALILSALGAPAAAADRPIRILALGDSLTAGYGLGSADAFPVRLQAALAERGIHAELINAGVSGDTVDQGLARLDWSTPDGVDAAIVELGANDMLRGLDPKRTREGLDEIVGKLRAKGIEVLVAGMQAAPNLGPAYAAAFNPIFPDIAAKHGALLYPFFLDGVAGDRGLNQPDGLHPTRAGVDVIVARILPRVEELVGRVRAKRS